MLNLGMPNACRQFFLEHENTILITRINIELPPHHSAKVPGWFFLCLKHYLINVKTNVSNARMNIPKAIRSLKSK